MKKTFVLCLLLIGAYCSYAQQNTDEAMKARIDSIKAAYLEEAALKNPIIRQAGVSIETIAAGEVKSKLNGNDLYKGDLQFTRVNARFNVPIAKIQRFNVSASFGMLYQHATLNNATSYNAQLPIQDWSEKSTTLSASVGISRVDSLFRRPVVYSLRVAELFDPTTGQTRLSGNGLISLTLKKTANTTLGVGALILLDPSAPVPFAPLVSYYHNFGNKLELFLDPPLRVALRKELSPNRFLSLHTTLGGSTVFIEHNQPMLPQDFVFSTTELKTGLLYEQRMTRKMMLEVSGGVSTSFGQKTQERKDYTSEPFIKSTQSPLPYLNVGVSFLPFWN